MNTKRKYTKKQKAIVCDSDDCLVDFCGMLIRLHNKLHGTCISPSDLTEYDMKKLEMEDARGTKVTGEELYQTFMDYEPHGLYASLKPHNEARHALNIIRRLGYRIIVMTARKPEFEAQTRFCFLHQNLEHDEIIFTPSTDKAKEIRRLAKTYNIIAFVDDKASTCIDVAESTNVNQVYIVNQRHNRDIELPEEIVRVDGVFDIVRDLEEV